MVDGRWSTVTGAGVTIQTRGFIITDGLGLWFRVKGLGFRV
jgi:hypothetical protein